MRDGQKYMVLVESLKDHSRDKLIELIVQQAEQIDELREEDEKLRQQINDLKKRIEELEREKHRQTGPFRRDKSKKVTNPKPSGRKPGHKGAYRKPPNEIDETIEVPLDCCPKCNGELTDVKEIKQIIEEIPEVKPKRYELITYRGHCERCGEIQSAHPLKTSDATGAAKVQLGPRAKATALILNYHYGLSKRKTKEVMQTICGISATASGWHYACWRLGKKCEGEYQKLLEQAKQADYLHSDETSWYMGSPKSWLWVFANKDQTLYKIADNRGRAIIQEVIGENYKGTLISDCLVIYDDVNSKQQKCYAHHLKAIKEAKEKHAEKGAGFLEEVESVLKTAMLIKKVKDRVPLTNYQQACENLERKADQLLLSSRADPIEESIANRLRKQRDHLFTFLYEQNVDPTNNLAERQLRPAVIARKLSCGNKTRKGADTWQVLTSLLVTNNQIGNVNLDFFRQKAVFEA